MNNNPCFRLDPALAAEEMAEERYLEILLTRDAERRDLMLCANLAAGQERGAGEESSPPPTRP